MCSHVCTWVCSGQEAEASVDSVRRTEGRRPRGAALARLDEDENSERKPLEGLVTHLHSVHLAVCLLGFSVSTCAVTWNAAVLFQFLCSRGWGSLGNSKAPLQTDQLREKGKQVIWAKPKAVEGGRGGRLGGKLTPLCRAVPVAHRWGVSPSKGEAAGWNREAGVSAP